MREVPEGGLIPYGLSVIRYTTARLVMRRFFLRLPPCIIVLTWTFAADGDTFNWEVRWT